MFALKLFLWLIIGAAAIGYGEYYEAGPTVEQRRDLYLRQFADLLEEPRDLHVSQEIRRDFLVRRGCYVVGGIAWAFLGVLLFGSDIKRAVC